MPRKNYKKKESLKAERRRQERESKQFTDLMKKELKKAKKNNKHQ